MKRLLILIVLSMFVSGCVHNKISVIDNTTSNKVDVDAWQIAFDECKDTKVSNVSFTLTGNTINNLVVECE